MKKIEKFLNSGWYIGLIFLIVYISWFNYKETSPFDFNLYNMIGIIFLILILTFVLSCFKNTLYATPIIIGILFTISKNDMTFDTVGSMGFPFIALGLLLAGFVIHLIRFKPKLKKGTLTWGLLLIAFAYIIPLLYTPFQWKAIPVSFVSFLYLGIYLILYSTTKGDMYYLLKILLFVNILLTLQMLTVIGRGVFLNYETNIYDSILVGIDKQWYRNFGWGNTNDVSFYIALTLPSYIYFVIRKSNLFKRILLWSTLVLAIMSIVLSGSRGGFIGLVISVSLSVLFLYFKTDPKHRKKVYIMFFVSAILFVVFFRFFQQVWYAFLNTLGNNVEDFSNSRLFIYREGWSIFLKHPLFGAGWLSIGDVAIAFGWPKWRIFMYHSTIVQTLAAMGLFGLVALLIHYLQVFRVFFTRTSLEKSLILFGYIATQIHGLIDNVQYSVPYSVMIVVIFSIIETSEKETVFELKNNKYITIENEIPLKII